MTKLGRTLRWGITGGIAVVLGGPALVARADQGAISRGVNDTQNAATSATKTIGNAAETTGNTVGNAAQSAGETADSAANTAGNAMSGTNQKGAANDDSSITERVKDQLASAGGQESKLDVDTDSAVVTLSGTVSTEAARMRAVKATKHVNGVKNINDEIQVKPNSK